MSTAHATYSLPPPLPGERFVIDAPRIGAVSVYTSRPSSHAAGPPVVLVHSVNAAASAYEVRPIYERVSASRVTYAFDLPGFGLSDRSDREYTPRLMTDALLEVIDRVRERHGEEPVDALALSLGCEFLARAANEQPDRFRTLALISPTGLEKRARRAGPEGSTRGMSWVRSIVTAPVVDDCLFGNLTRPSVVRYFLEKTWGRDEIDEELWAYDVRTTNAPGAKHAPLWFVSGFLFSADVARLYEALEVPVWMGHGVRGDFVDYGGVERLRGRGNWKVRAFDTGALPHFEMPDELADEYLGFLEAAG